MVSHLIRPLALLICLSIAAPARASEPPPLPEPPVIRAARRAIQPLALRPQEPTAERWERERTLAHASLVIGGVGFLAAATSFLLRRRVRRDDSCRAGRCPASGREESSAARALDKVTAVGTAVGIAGAAAGITLLLLERSEKKSARTRRGASAVVSPSYVGLKVRF